jgi:hypothetical protein
MVRGVERWYVDFDKCIPTLPRRRHVEFALRRVRGPIQKRGRSYSQKSDNTLKTRRVNNRGKQQPDRFW